MKKALLVFDDRRVFDVRVDREEKVLFFRSSEYDLVPEEDYYIAPSLGKDNTVYIRFYRETEKSKECPHLEEIKQYHKKTNIETLKEAKRILYDCWEEHLDELIDDPSASLRDITEIYQLLNRIKEFIERRERINRNREIMDRGKKRRGYKISKPQKAALVQGSPINPVSLIKH